MNDIEALIAELAPKKGGVRLPPSVKKAVRRAAFEESRASYEVLRIEISDWAAKQIRSGAKPGDILAQLECRTRDAVRSNALRGG